MNQIVLTQDQIEGFLEKIRSEGKTQSNIAEYCRNLNRLYNTAQQHNGILTEEVLADWKSRQLQQGLAAGTVTNRVVKINHFLRYLNLEKLCFPNGGRQNLAGRRFGDLLVIEPTDKRAVDRSIYWKCRCTACGKEKLIPANQLKKGVQLSCGCERSKRLQKTNGYIDGTCLKNVLSHKINKNNTSGYKGVFQKRGRWAACIQYKKKNYYLGSYDRLEDAVEARKEAEIRVREDAERLMDKLKETSK